METISIVCLCVLCALMAAGHALFGQKTGWQGLVVRGASILSCIALALVSANFKGLTNALPLFVTLGLSILVLGEALKDKVPNEKTQRFVSGIVGSLGFILIALGGLSLSQFNMFALIGGVFFGIALGFIVCGIKKYKTIDNVLNEIFSFMSIGFILGFGLMAFVSSTHLLSAICMLGGGVILVFQKLVSALGKNGTVTNAISNLLFMLALTAISLSIYLY